MHECVYTLCVFGSSVDLVEQVISKKTSSSIICSTSYYGRIVCYYWILCTWGGTLTKEAGN